MTIGGSWKDYQKKKKWKVVNKKANKKAKIAVRKHDAKIVDNSTKATVKKAVTQANKEKSIVKNNAKASNAHIKQNTIVRTPTSNKDYIKNYTIANKRLRTAHDVQTQVLKQQTADKSRKTTNAIHLKAANNAVKQIKNDNQTGIQKFAQGMGNATAQQEKNINADLKENYKATKQDKAKVDNKLVKELTPIILDKGYYDKKTFKVDQKALKKDKAARAKMVEAYGKLHPSVDLSKITNSGSYNAGAQTRNALIAAMMSGGTSSFVGGATAGAAKKLLLKEALKRTGAFTAADVPANIALGVMDNPHNKKKALKEAAVNTAWSAGLAGLGEGIGAVARAGKTAAKAAETEKKVDKIIEGKTAKLETTLKNESHYSVKNEKVKGSIAKGSTKVPETPEVEINNVKHVASIPKSKLSEAAKLEKEVKAGKITKAEAQKKLYRLADKDTSVSAHNIKQFKEIPDSQLEKEAKYWSSVKAPKQEAEDLYSLSFKGIKKFEKELSDKGYSVAQKKALREARKQFQKDGDVKAFKKAIIDEQGGRVLDVTELPNAGEIYHARALQKGGFDMTNPDGSLTPLGERLYRVKEIKRGAKRDSYRIKPNTREDFKSPTQLHYPDRIKNGARIRRAEQYDIEQAYLDAQSEFGHGVFKDVADEGEMYDSINDIAALPAERVTRGSDLTRREQIKEGLSEADEYLKAVQNSKAGKIPRKGVPESERVLTDDYMKYAEASNPTSERTVITGENQKKSASPIKSTPTVAEEKIASADVSKLPAEEQKNIFANDEENSTKILLDVTKPDKEILDRVKAGSKQFYRDWVNSLQAPEKAAHDYRKMGGSSRRLAAKRFRRGELTEAEYKSAVAEADRMTAVADSIESATNAYRLANAKATRSILVNQVDFNGKAVGKSVKDIFADFTPEEKAEFGEYMFMKHNIARSENGKPVMPELTSKESEAWVKEFEKDMPDKFKQASDDVYKYEDNIRKMEVESGLTSQEASDLLEKTYQYYVPTRRLKDTGYEQTYDIANPAGKKRNAIGTSEFHAAKGSGEDLLPIDVQLSMLSRDIYKKAEENNLIKKIAGAQGNLIVKMDGTVDDAINALNFFEHDGDKYYIRYYDNGNLVRTQTSKDMYESFKAFDAMGKAGNEYVRLATEALSGANDTFKKLITSYSIGFAFRNPMRDFGDAMFQTKNGLKTFMSCVPGAVKDVFTDGKYVNDMLNQGVGGASFFDISDLTAKGASKWAKLNPLKQLEKLNEVLELVPRTAEYMATLKKAGKTLETADKETRSFAALNASDVTTNFQRGGKYDDLINRGLVPFFRASMQGFDKFVRNFTDAAANKTIARLILRATAAGIAPSVINEIAMSGNENYQALNPRDKLNNFIIPTNPADKNCDTFWKIPKARALVVLGAPVQAAVSKDRADMWGAIVKFDGNVLVNAIAPQNPVTNNIVSPIVGAANNETWYGQKIVNDTLSKNSRKGLQTDANTTRLATSIGKKSDELSYKLFGADKDYGVSPKKIDYLMKQYSGGIGQVVMPSLTPSKTGNGIVGDTIGAMAKSNFQLDTVYQNQIDDKFYNKLNNYTKLSKTPYATKEQKQTQKKLNDVSTRAADIYKTIKELQTGNDPDKQTKIRELTRYRNSMLKDALDGKTTNKLADIDIQQKYLGTKYVVNNFADKNTQAAYKMYSKTKGADDEKFYKAYRTLKAITPNGGGTDVTKAVAIASVHGGKEMYKAFGASEYRNKAKRYLNSGGTIDELVKTQKYMSKADGSVTRAMAMVMGGGSKATFEMYDNDSHTVTGKYRNAALGLISNGITMKKMQDIYTDAKQYGTYITKDTAYTMAKKYGKDNKTRSAIYSSLTGWNVTENPFGHYTYSQSQANKAMGTKTVSKTVSKKVIPKDVEKYRARQANGYWVDKNHNKLMNARVSDKPALGFRYSAGLDKKIAKVVHEKDADYVYYKDGTIWKNPKITVKATSNTPSSNSSSSSSGTSSGGSSGSSRRRSSGSSGGSSSGGSSKGATVSALTSNIKSVPNHHQKYTPEQLKLKHKALAYYLKHYQA